MLANGGKTHGDIGQANDESAAERGAPRIPYFYGWSKSGRSPRDCERRERQLEGIAKAKAQGVYKGRKASIDPARVKQLKADGLGPTEIARTLKIGRASVYRVLGQIEAAASNTSRADGGPAPHAGPEFKAVPAPQHSG
jgi:Helix-turn-helix domain of resolvase